MRIAHGSNSVPLVEAPLTAAEAVDNNSAVNFQPPTTAAAGGAASPAVVTVATASPAAAAPAPSVTPHFSCLFKGLLENEEALLPNVTKAASILRDLNDLGVSMLDEKHDVTGNSSIPSIYTYFGQFLDHDVTFTNVKKPDGFTDAQVLRDDTQLSPWSLDNIQTMIENRRGGVLELDSVYGLMPPDTPGGERKPPPRSGDLMTLSLVTKTGGRPPGKTDDEHDLPRMPKSLDERLDRAALIADPRNDSNLIVAQLHVAFLRAHNELVRRGNSFEQARLTLRNCYHWIVVNDFLMQLADPAVVEQVRAGTETIYNPSPDERPCLPLEYTVGAYRFGHSMIRETYYVNDLAPGLSLSKLFMLIILGRGLEPQPGKGADTLPENMIIQWEGFLKGPTGKNKARQINTRMVRPLFGLFDERDRLVDGERSLAVQDLKRGYMMGLPTGQAVARELKITNPITSDEIEALAREVSDKQLDALTRPDTKLSSRTPLWFYILAEGKIRGEGNRLGPVGSRLVAEVLIGLIRRIPDSFLHTGWKPGNLGFRKDEFTLTDLLRLAKVLPKNF
ncbi:MAG TPA: peroxidase family protein [Pyrinomonadaceae bacterium]|nr:peroxidase family protein [Pyrinomonadaceae bacterium]